MATVTAEPDRQGLEQLIARATTAYRSVGETVYAILREAITTGTFAPGDWLRQESLAEMMGVSRIPVRSALIQLESEGLVIFQPRRGVQVRRLTLEQVRECYELRAVLESHALRQSMSTMTTERLDRLARLADRLDTVAEGTEFLETRRLFYLDLYDGERNPLLVKMIEELRASVGLYLLRKRLAGQVEHSHRHLLDAVAAGDPDAAVDTLLRHLAVVRAGVEHVVAEKSRLHLMFRSAPLATCTTSTVSSIQSKVGR